MNNKHTIRRTILSLYLKDISHIVPILAYLIGKYGKMAVFHNMKNVEFINGNNAHDTFYGEFDKAIDIIKGIRGK